MSSGSINITWGVSRNFEEADLDLVLSGYAAVAEPRSKYEKSVWSVNGLTIKLYERTLFAQGKYTTSGVNIVSAINKLDGLSLDRNNRGKMTALKPVCARAVVCAHKVSPSRARSCSSGYKMSCARGERHIQREGCCDVICN